MQQLTPRLPRPVQAKDRHLIEAVTYRLGDHTTADDASRYRSAEEVQEHWKEEPLARLRTYLVKRFNWSKAQEEEVTSECNQRVDAAIERYLEITPRAPETMFDISMPSCPASTPASVRKLRTRMPEVNVGRVYQFSARACVGG